MGWLVVVSRRSSWLLLVVLVPTRVEEQGRSVQSRSPLGEGGRFRICGVRSVVGVSAWIPEQDVKTAVCLTVRAVPGVGGGAH